MFIRQKKKISKKRGGEGSGDLTTDKNEKKNGGSIVVGYDFLLFPRSVNP